VPDLDALKFIEFPSPRDAGVVCWSCSPRSWPFAVRLFGLIFGQPAKTL